MEQLTCVGVWTQGVGTYGVWGQISVKVGSRSVPVDVRITGAYFNAEEAENLARQIHAAQGHACEFLPVE